LARSAHRRRSPQVKGTAAPSARDEESRGLAAIFNSRKTGLVEPLHFTALDWLKQCNHRCAVKGR
jgi:hypothetical protein